MAVLNDSQRNPLLLLFCGSDKSKKIGKGKYENETGFESSNRETAN
jgi:hypothetical protein